LAVHTDLLIYLAVVGGVWVAYLVRKRWRSSKKPHLGDDAAYDGNLLIPPPGHGPRGRPTFRSSHGADHLTHGPGHGGHVGGHHAGTGHH
jgi:hypothetical protein